jgi:UrcA family protein
MMTKTYIAAVALASFIASTPASAESYAFRYWPHELQTAGGRSVMMARLDSQVERFCEVNDSRGIHTVRAAKQCKEDVIAEILSKIDNVQFASLAQ